MASKRLKWLDPICALAFINLVFSRSFKYSFFVVSIKDNAEIGNCSIIEFFHCFMGKVDNSRVGKRMFPAVNSVHFIELVWFLY